MTIKNRFPLAVSYDSNNDPSGLAEFEPKTTDLSDIGDSTPSTGQVLTWTDDGKYQPQTPTGGGGGAVNSVNDLTGDVDLYVSSLSGLDLTNLGGAPGEGGGLLPQIIEWDGANSQWKAVYEEQQFIRIKNNTGATLTKGQVVHAYGFQGDQALVGLAKADSSTTMPSIGVVYADILDTESGLVVSFGTADIDNTLTIEGSPAPGDTLYVSPNASGDLTATKPTATSHLIQNVGILLKAAPGAKVKVTGVGRSNDIPNTIALGPAGETTITSATAKFTGTTASQVVTTNASNQVSSQSIATIVGDTSTGADLQDLKDVDGETLIGDARVGKIIQFQGTGQSAEWKLVSVAEATNYDANPPEGEDVPAASQIDHGVLSGLGDDDHTQYVLSAGTRSMSALTVNNEITTKDIEVTRLGPSRPTSITHFSDWLSLDVRNNGYSPSLYAGGTHVQDSNLVTLNTTEYGIGVLRLKSGTTSNAQSRVMTYDASIAPSTCGVSFAGRVCPSGAWETGVNEGVITMGIHNRSNSNNLHPNAGAWFQYDHSSSNWQAITGWFTVSSNTNTGVAATPESFQVLQIKIDENWQTFDFYIDGSSVATHTISTHNVPTSSRYGFTFSVRNGSLAGPASFTSTGNELFLDWDYRKLTHTATDRGESYIQ